GALAPDDYAESVLPHPRSATDRTRTLLRDAPAPGAGPSHLTPHSSHLEPPIVYFGTDMNGMLPLLRETGADVLGLDWRVNLDDGWAQYGHDVAVQGNLDPMALHGPWPEVERRARRILERAAGRPGHIFNVGHGILTETPEDNVRRLVEFVQSYPSAGGER
ncbi:MAG TPA: uroporphyrinogen decarboxylase family protein, partial [Chloroflexaceae bacterium]|nr:uroporphyrinogen decarboxylase family protein [Chloroflexaceae bacterium]